MTTDELKKKKNAPKGVIMIQIDGFSRKQFEKALDENSMPFLKKLLRKKGYRLQPLYTGLPSTTPSIQGELFYGVKQAVPSFFFFDKATQKVFKMFDGESVRTIEERLAKQGTPLLEGGSSYSNIYTAGAKEAHFCAGSLGWNYIWKDVNPVNFILMVCLHLFAVIRMIILVIWETVLALMDFIYGVFKKEDLMVEVKFVPLRVLLCILLRELITFGAIMDIKRGLPIIHLNYIGYDEQAHRRKPSSKTAHWALKGIDASIGKIYYAAQLSSKKNYDVWIYSDHGQESTIPYVGHFGKSVEESIPQLYKELFPKDEPAPAPMHYSPKKHKTEGIQLQRARYFGDWTKKIWELNHTSTPVPEDVIVAAMGPMGGVYLTKEISEEAKKRFAQELVTKGGIPLVLMPEGPDQARVFNKNGEFFLPENAKEILGADHPYLKEVTKDLISLCHHANAGTFTISGWRLNEEPLSFPFENGAHAGPGKEETNPFVLAPIQTFALPVERNYVTTMDLRNTALTLLNKKSPSISIPQEYSVKKTIRVMTYNVHSCIGMDGKVSPQRIARVIADHKPDIVALQELDMGRKRTGKMDQPHLIAKELEMTYHFHPSLQVQEEKYGNAILSRYPMELVYAAKLPTYKKFKLEARGAIWVSVKIDDVTVQIINAHLSFYGPETRTQVRALVGNDWIANPKCKMPVIVCGDFNCEPDSDAWRIINYYLFDAQKLLNQHKPLATWFGKYPISRIDHIFVSSGIKVLGIDVPRTKINKVASDHLPLIVDMEVFK